MDHINWLETQLRAIDALGATAYLAEQLKKDDGASPTAGR
jgi:bacterioferritin (cytochrome b1)